MALVRCKPTFCQHVNDWIQHRWETLSVERTHDFDMLCQEVEHNVRSNPAGYQDMYAILAHLFLIGKLKI